MYSFFRQTIFRLSCAMILVTAALAGHAIAQEYPVKPIRIITSYGAGSTTDLVARLIAPLLAEYLGKQVIVENRPGGNGFIAANAVAKSAPDGYTILGGSSTTMNLAPSLYKALPIDPGKDLTPITTAVYTPFFFITGTGFPGNSIKDLVEAAKEKRGKFTIAHKSLTPQLAIELFKLTAGIDVTSVPYKELFPAFVDLASGELDALLEPVPSSVSQIKAGRVKVLAVSSSVRSSIMPNIPTVAESGYPGFDAGAMVAFYAPVGTPKEIIARLNSEIVRAVNSPSVREKLVQAGGEIITSTPEQMAEQDKGQTAQWAQVVKKANLPKLD